MAGDRGRAGNLRLSAYQHPYHSANSSGSSQEAHWELQAACFLWLWLTRRQEETTVEENKPVFSTRLVGSFNSRVRLEGRKLESISPLDDNCTYSEAANFLEE